MTSTFRMLRTALLASATTLGLVGAALAQEPPPPMHGPSPNESPIPAPQDVAYPGGTLRLHVDATDLDRHIFRIKETIPVKAAGPMTILFPKWVPGGHSPRNPLDQMAGLIIHADGKRVEWVRDPLEVYAFHVNVPTGAKALELEYEHVSPTATNQGRVVMTPEMLNLEWLAMTFYPAGYYARKIPVEASVTLPEGWKMGTALERASESGSTTTFKTQPLDILVDSPIYAGKYFERLDLDPGSKVPVFMDIVADNPDELEYKPEYLAAHRKLVQEAYKAFQSHHYDHYDFLVSFSKKMSGNGLEHHRSSEDGTSENYFKEWDKQAGGRDLLAHEYTHSWDGKFRRGQDLWTPNYEVAMRDSLLWVYEGQTQYWGYVLAARSGLWTKQQGIDSLANVAAQYDHRIGREWKALEDTTNDPVISGRRPIGWRSWQRSEDYYSEGQLIWLTADQLIRQKTGGAKSLDDFAGKFFGVYNGSFTEVTYSFEDVVKTLNEVYPYDWATFLHGYLYGHGPGAPLDWIKMGGYKLVYTETQNAMQKGAEAQRHNVDLSYSLGLSIGRDGAIGDVTWEGPAFKAGLVIGETVVAVNGVTYDGDDLKKAVTAAKGKGAPVELLIKDGDRYRMIKIDWHEGLKYPHLEPLDATKTAGLDQLLTPRS